MTILFILAILLAALSVWFSARPYLPPYLTAYGALWLLKWSGVVHPGTWLMTSWGIAAAIMLVIDLAQPKAISKATNGLLQMSVGALAGTMVGLCAVSYVWMAVGAVAGTVVGVLAFMRTPSGQALGVGSPQFFRYIPAKFFPVAVTYCLLGIFALLLIMAYAPGYAVGQVY